MSPPVPVPVTDIDDPAVLRTRWAAWKHISQRTRDYLLPRESNLQHGYICCQIKNLLKLQRQGIA